MPQERWDGLIGLSSDVVLRTADYQGSLAAELYDLTCGWIFARLQEPDDSDFMFEPGLTSAKTSRPRCSWLRMAGTAKPSGRCGAQLRR
jgi:hypothetical protein